MTIGLAYSGRIKGFFDIWIKNLIEDIKILSYKPELIIFDNSNNNLPSIKKYKIHFDNIQVIKGIPPKKYKNRGDKKDGVSKLLANTYNQLLHFAKYDLIHIREDDIISTKTSFKILYNNIIKKDKNILGVSGIYLNRNVIPHKLQTIKTVPNEMIIDYIPTGYIMFWKNLSPKYDSQIYTDKLRIRTHDWVWCEKALQKNLKLKLFPIANVKHWIDKNKYIQYTNQVINSKNVFCKYKLN